MGDKVKIRELDPATQDLLVSLYKGHPDGFVRVGEGGYILPLGYQHSADDIKNMPVRPDDTWMVTYPRSGTTWTQELVWLLMNDLDYETALKIPLMGRYFFVEMTSLASLSKPNKEKLSHVMLQKFLKLAPSFQAILNAASPRFMKSHLPLSLLPDNLLDTAKVVYVARDPRDVAVSYFHHNRLFKNRDFVGDFKSFWNLFVNDLVTFTPFFPRLKEAWALRHHPNMLFIFYEDLKRDLPGSVMRIAKFLGKEITSEQTKKLCEHLDIKNFRNNESVNPKWLNETGNPSEEGFIRQGKSGGWRDYFDEGMAAQAHQWICANLADTDLLFPDALNKNI